MIGADGIHSAIRELAFGPESNYLRYLGFHTAAYTFADPELHNKLGEQFAITDSVDKTVGLFPIRDERIAVFAAHRTPDPAIPADPRMAVQTTYSDLGWLSPTHSLTALIPQPSTTTRYPRSRCHAGLLTGLGWSAMPVRLSPFSLDKAPRLPSPVPN